MAKKTKAQAKAAPAAPAVIPAAKPPPANDSCAVCYFSEQDANGVWRCCFYPPAWQRSSLPATGLNINWPIVDPDDWCGHGYNTTTNQWMTPNGAVLP